MLQTTLFSAATIAGYPHIDAKHEFEHNLGCYWTGKINRATFNSEVSRQVDARTSHLKGFGLDGATVQPADSVPYDQVLTLTCILDAVPQRFRNLVRPDGSLDVDGEFTLACGVDDKVALETTKWFDTNHHCLVPEIGPYTPIKPVTNPWPSQVAAGGRAGRPALVGPVTYLLGAGPARDAPAQFNPLDRSDDVLAAFEVFLAQLAGVGMDWVQLDKSGLMHDTQALPHMDMLVATAKAYDPLGGLLQRSALFVNAPYGDLGPDGHEALVGTPIETIGLGLMAGQAPAAGDLAWLEGRAVVAGVISGRNI